jgi:regulatory protein
MERKVKHYTPLQAKAKAMHYCAYQERAQEEVRQKLREWGLNEEETEQLITTLIEENFLNEERFAYAFATGKHRMKQWGKIKIKMGLKRKGVSSPLIRMALQKLDDQEYRKTLGQILTKEAHTLKEKDPFKRKYKLIQAGLRKGYEQELILELLTDNHL